MIKKIGLAVIILAVLTGCTPTAEEANPDEPQTSVISGNKGDYSIISPFVTSPLRTTYAQGFRETDVLEIGRRLQDKSKEYFAPSSYFVSEGSVLDETRYNELTRRRSDSNPFGLNPASEGEPLVDQIYDEKGEVTGEVTIPKPYFVSDITELTFHKDKNRKEVDGVSFALVLDRYQVLDNGSYHYLSDDTFYRLANDYIAVQFEAYLRNRVPGLEETPIMIAFYVQDSAADMGNIVDNAPGKFVPGHYIAHGYYKDQRESGTLTRDNEQWLLLNSTEASTQLPQSYGNFSVFKRKIANYFGDENIGVIGMAFVVDGKIQQYQIEVNTGSKTQLELYGITQYLSSIVTELDSSDVPITVNVKLYQNTRAVINYTPGQTPVTTFVY
ncbi:hypothetical protein G7062_04910 [Erysipelothrix sp. HDW6C]|uniref:CamS family sex pheromone protein n=1 Tax=Erysipelothrix sp. HDW6C TaxID=2714930 RepID=UPI00140782C0|nr:CamS family sex pheromone protein [Erysipelothrix sp. HDW6C]QIK69678.1 hypothetical protein G7062_04910 [Erysipelothrix sp. HDW6C]